MLDPGRCPWVNGIYGFQPYDEMQQRHNVAAYYQPDGNASGYGANAQTNIEVQVVEEWKFWLSEKEYGKIEV